MSLDLPVIYHFLDKVDSTNTWVKERHPSFDLTRLHVVFAAEQTKGKGTHGKSWLSPKDLNIYATFFFSLPKENSYQTLAQLLSLTIASILTNLGFAPTIKWPNDLLLDEKKIGGILCETTPLQDFLLCILGFGLNVNMPQSLCDTIDQPTSSLLASSGITFSTQDLLEKIALKFQKDLKVYLLKKFVPFYQNYNSYMIYKNYPVVFQEKVLGSSIGVNAQGELEIKTLSGNIQAITYGSIKLQ